MDSHLFTDIADASIPFLQKPFRFLHSLLQKILLEGHMEGIFEHSSKVYRIQVNMGCHRYDGQFFVIQVFALVNKNWTQILNITSV